MKIIQMWQKKIFLDPLFKCGKKDLKILFVYRPVLFERRISAKSIVNRFSLPNSAKKKSRWTLKDL